MKKLFISLLIAGGLLTSCDMDKNPIGALDGESAIQTLNDASNYRNGIYTGLRGFTASGFFTDVEIQMENFQATQLCGNRGLLYAGGDIRATSGEIVTYWSALYTRIASINYFLEKVEPLYQAAIAAEDNEAVVTYERYIGEAHFARAYYNWCMFDRFCPAYTEADKDKDGLGIAIVTKYYPTANRGSYPGRSTQAKSIEFIKSDLDVALKAMEDYEKVDNSGVVPMASYINSNVVKALQARVALNTLDYKTAIEKSEAVITSGDYALATPKNYNDMWLNDDNDEIIFMPFEQSPSEIGAAIGLRWLSVYSDRSDYIPTYDALAMYLEGDCRFDSYFDVIALNFEGTTVPAFGFFKFPGNPALRETPTDNNVVNMPKPFRLSELYLIAAEAACSSSNTPLANKYLNELRQNRIDGWEDETLSGNTLVEEIRYERNCELIGEGFHMSDMRRWRLSAVRKKAHEENPAIEPYLWQSTASITYDANDYRYTWPIPQSELDVNPQMAGQQNRGY